MFYASLVDEGLRINVNRFVMEGGSVEEETLEDEYWDPDVGYERGWRKERLVLLSLLTLCFFVCLFHG